jgi:hypothetical protein
MPRAIATLLMFDGVAEEAMTFYLSLFKGSEIKRIERFGSGSRSRNQLPFLSIARARPSWTTPSNSFRQAARHSCRWTTTDSARSSGGSTTASAFPGSSTSTGRSHDH